VNNGICLAVFNSCRGAYTATDDAEAGWRQQNLVQALVNRGVPGVIAMAERIPDDVAVTFTRLLYRNLQQGYAVDLCLSRVRQGLISAYRSDQPFWMLPILYLRPDFDGYLYTRASATETDRPTDEETSLLGVLPPPDYSSDPDISGLAEEMLAGHLTSPLAIPELDADSSRFNPVQAESTPAFETGQFPQPPGPEPGPTVDGSDLIQALEHHRAPEEDSETASMSQLVQQLSHQAEPSNRPTAEEFTPVVNDDSWLTDGSGSTANLDQLLPPNSAQSQTFPRAKEDPALAGEDAGNRLRHLAPLAWLKSPAWPKRRMVWIGLGLMGVVAVAALGVIPLSRLGNEGVDPESTPPPAVAPLPNGDPPPSGEPELNITGRDSAVITAAVGALTADKSETAAKFIEQLLDQGDLEAAASVIGTAQPGQLLEPELAFVRGRLTWQALKIGRQDMGSPHDAQRYWAQAIEVKPDYIEAWIALGFANYVLGDFHGALKSWEQAIGLDRQNLQDIDPGGQIQYSSNLTLNAYAGLVMVNQKLSELNPVDRQQAQLQQRAKTYFEQVVNLKPQLLVPETMALEWIWSPDLLQSWQTTIKRVTVSP